MENKQKTTTLQKKIALLTALREGNVQKSHQLLQELSQTTKTKPELYQQFDRFITQHKEQIIQAQEEQKQQRELQPQIVLVEGGFDDQWKTDDSVSLSSEDEKEEEIEIKQPKKEVRLLKNLANSKSAILLKPVKEVKRQFLVQTKPKQNINFSSTLNLRQQRRKSNPKQAQEIVKTQYQTSKPYFLHKKSIKQVEGSHFPPINSSKQTLKL